MSMLPLEPGSPFEASFLNTTPVDKWDTQDVAEWLKSLNLGEYQGKFQENDIDGSVLLLLERSSLKTLVNKVGDRIKVQMAVKELRYRDNWSAPPSASCSRFEEPLSSAGSHSALTSLSLAPVSELSFVYPDGQSRTVSIGALRNATDAKHLVLREVFPTIDRAAAETWAISRGDRQLSEAEILNLAHEHSNKGLLRIHQLEAVTPHIAPRQRSLHRPSSRHISRNLKEFFPNVPSGELEQTMRNSVMLTRRLSVYDPQALDVRRMSNIIGEGAPGGSAPGGNTPGSNRRTGTPQAEAKQLLDQFKAEEATPSKWMRGSCLGSGSFGTVYMAVNGFTGELMAVKQVELPTAEGVDEARKKKMADALKHEVHMMRDFDHKNIVQYRGFKQEGSTLNIFLEYVPGGSLASMLNQVGAFEETLVSQYIKHIVSGLVYLHERQVIHRDIKGANILVDDKGQCKISDFGLSKKVETQQLLQKNHRQSMQGSSFWMAPEVVKQMPPTMKSDIWSLGCLVIELLTGNHPFPRLTQIQAIFKLGNMVKPQLPDGISSKAEDFLNKTLETNPASRPTAMELERHPFLQG